MLRMKTGAYYVISLSIDYTPYQSGYCYSCRDRREAIISQMTTFSGERTTVPQIFFNAKHMGGYDDIRQMDEEGRLEKEVEHVRVTPAPRMQPHWFHPWY